MEKPTKEEIKKWVEDETTQYLLGRWAFYINSIDTVRNIKNDNETVSRRLAIEIFEAGLADIYGAGELEKYQKRIADEEENVIKKMRELKREY